MTKTQEVTKKKSTKISTSGKNKKATKNAKNKKGKNKVSIKLILGLIGLIIFVSLIIISIILSNKEETIITIDGIKYTESDFNMYAYLVKYDYFGIDGTKLTEETLETLISNDSEKTIGEYLKEKTISKIKVSAAILRIAEEYNITLNEEDLKEIADEKKLFIEKVGGKKEFKLLLKDNDTNEEAYMKVAKINKLYDIIYNSLYREGKRNDLTTEELDIYKKSYQTDYVKIKQIILLKKDLENNTYLSEAIINQKESLANSLAKEAKETKNIDSLIVKYSEGYQNEVKSEYYLKDNLVDELKTAINKLDIGDISDVVSTDYAYHIVVREELDNEKLNEYLDTKREEKFIKNISNNLEKIVIINGDYLEEITVK